MRTLIASLYLILADKFRVTKLVLPSGVFSFKLNTSDITDSLTSIDAAGKTFPGSMDLMEQACESERAVIGLSFPT